MLGSTLLYFVPLCIRDTQCKPSKKHSTTKLYQHYSFSLSLVVIWFRCFVLLSYVSAAETRQTSRMRRIVNMMSYLWCKGPVLEFEDTHTKCYLWYKPARGGCIGLLRPLLWHPISAQNPFCLAFQRRAQVAVCRARFLLLFDGKFLHKALFP